MKITALASAYIAGILVFMNLVSFITFGADKYKAKKGKWRISEKTLIMLALFGGSTGAVLGMKVFRHKTLHAKFKYGVPAIMILHILILILILFCALVYKGIIYF